MIYIRNITCILGGKLNMNIINMVDDFKLLCKEMNDIGKFQAYKIYTKKYPQLFEGVFKGLYMTNIDNLKDMINCVDFSKNLKIAQDNEKNGIVEQIIKEAKKVVALLNFTEDFDLYIGMELGNL